MVLSMLVSPFILAKSDVIVMKFSANEWMMQSLALTQIAARTMNAKKHVIIAGFGRSGQSLARLLEEEASRITRWIWTRTACRKRRWRAQMFRMAMRRAVKA
jgi:glutamate dehydrogenase/leucine dehydrogenase